MVELLNIKKNPTGLYTLKNKKMTKLLTDSQFMDKQSEGSLNRLINPLE